MKGRRGIERPPASDIQLSDVPMLRGLSPEKLRQFLSLAKEVRLKPGEVLIREGDAEDVCYVLTRGQLEVSKKDPETGASHVLTRLDPVVSVGEVALLDNKVRSATVRAATEATLLAVDVGVLSAHSEQEDSLEASIKINLGRELASSFRRLNDNLVKTLREELALARAQATAGIFVSGLFVAVCSYVYALQVVTTLTKGLVSTSLITIPLIALFCGIFGFAIRRTGHRLADYGVTLAGWGHSLAEGILFTLPLIAIVLAAKWVLLQTIAAAHGGPLFALPGHLHPVVPEVFVEAGAYAVFSPLQEFIARGCVQGTFQEFLVGKRRVLYSILISNLLFGMMHLHLSILFSLFVLVPGLFWGWLYSRHKTLIGVCVSHILLGVVAFWVIGFDQFIK